MDTQVERYVELTGSGKRARKREIMRDRMHRSYTVIAKQADELAIERARVGPSEKVEVRA